MKTLSPSEVIIIGGTFRGMADALELARSKKTVTLIEARTYLGYEITATLRPWLPVQENYPELLTACIEASGNQSFNGEIPLHLDAIKKRLEDVLLDAGINILYGCNPLERTQDGLIIGSKGGKWLIPCQEVINAQYFPWSKENAVPGSWSAITLEFEGCALAEYGNLSEMPAELDVPDNLGIVGNQVQLHHGFRKSANFYLRSHVLVECRMMIPGRDKDPFAYTQRYIDAREQALAVAEFLLWKHPAFRLASLGKVSEVIYETGMSEDLFHLRQGQELEMDLPMPEQVSMDWDVIVVGGGTSGALAAYAAATEGAKTLVVEMNPGLGGTGTYGGVSAYWMGWQKGFPALSRSWTNALHDRLRYPHIEGLLGIWNIEAKTQALLEKCQDKGVSLLFHTRVVDAVVKDGKLNSIIAATPCGVIQLSAKVFIDATGDGDVAAFAGASFTYGSRRDGIVMWYSLPQFKSPGRIKSNFTAMLDITDPLDYTRAIIWGRRRGGALYDHGSYLAPRETRHIQCDFTQSLADQLLCRAYSDVISVAISNNDMKGHTSSEWMKLGLIPPNLYIEISYGMLLPKGIEGLFVVGKAISIDRDALPSIRMQPDFENLGGAAGVAAGFSVRDGVGLRQVNLPAVQKRLVEIGSLPENTLTRSLEVYQPTDTMIQRWIDQIISDPQPLWAISTMEVNEVHHQIIPFAALCCSGEHGIALIKKALSKPLSFEARSKLGRALALMGSSSAVDILVSELNRILVRDKLPGLEGDIRHTCDEAPDQAAMPEAAYLLYALALCRDPRAQSIWQKVASLLSTATLKDIFSTQSGVFVYVDALCSGAESLGDPALIPILTQVAILSDFQGHSLTQSGYPSGQYADYLYERAAYLELVLARALARCGSPNGALTLINYLNDVRKIFSSHAQSELEEISGKHFGSDVHAWGEWLESAGDLLPPTPWITSLEAVSASKTKIQIMPEVLY